MIFIIILIFLGTSWWKDKTGEMYEPFRIITDTVSRGFLKKLYEGRIEIPDQYSSSVPFNFDLQLILPLFEES